REQAWRIGRTAFAVQWAGLLASTAFLWYILFTHQFQYQYVASYSSSAMPGHYVYAAFWGGQEGTFVLWALLTATLGLILMRVRHPLTRPAMLFLNLPLVMLALVTVMRGPFLTFPMGRVPMDGQGLNPLLQDPWMTIHPPVLFTGFSSLVVPFAIAMAALVKRDYDGWIKPVLPWAVFSTAILATGFIMGGVWAYKVLGWGGYWGWDPVENGSLIPWLSNIALLHGLLVQRATGSLRRTNFFLAVTSYVLVLYASFLTRSGVLADFSVHSFVNLGLNGFLLSFLFLTMIVGYGAWLLRLRDMPSPKEPLGSFSRESMMWLGQLVFMLMAALTAVGMSAPLITRLFGPPSNVQTSYYNLVNGPLAIALGLLLGIAPLMRWRKQEPAALMKAALPSVVGAVVLGLAAAALGVREPIPLAVVFGAAFALTGNLVVTVRGFRAGWKHGVAFLGHTGVAILLIGIIASSNYGRSSQAQLPVGETKDVLGYRLEFQGIRPGAGGQDRAVIAVNAEGGAFDALPALYWSEFNQGYMKKPHIQRYLAYDLYISPLEMVGGEEEVNGVWFSKGESKKVGEVTYTFMDFDRQMGDVVRVAARMRAEIGGRTVTVRPVLEINLKEGTPNRIPDYLPGGASVQIASVDPNTGRVALELPGMGRTRSQDILAVEVSTKPLINLVWLGAIVMLASAFMSMWRRALDVRRLRPEPTGRS
ncbi:MAG TPA: cytochrome c-type biogenesis CcmF C-terminal domain-containing protein, partial [Candidatus Eisenbacteria bacterium]|nr:cytochrome c-type biogenesis CcmF C-terminal domain-containing protein [Candidatus Eisenbacteria bacterium]